MIARHATPEVAQLAAQAAEIVREVVGPTTRVLWYGSWIQGTAVSRSDVDLAVLGEGPIPPAKMVRLRERIDALPTLRKIDVVDACAVGDAMRERIVSEGVRV